MVAQQLKLFWRVMRVTERPSFLHISYGADYFSGISYYASTLSTNCEISNKQNKIPGTIKY